MSTGFSYPPNPQILQWLSAGQLASRLQRSLRLWVLLTQLYGSESNWQNSLPQPFSYPDLRDRLFAASHPRHDHFSAAQLQCSDRTCICHKSLRDWILSQNEAEWRTEILHLTGLTASELDHQLQQYPFVTVHRSMRDDLKQLTRMGWLQLIDRGKYQCLPLPQLPTPPAQLNSETRLAQLSTSETWALMRVLESVAFVQPNLNVVINSLWQQLAPTSGNQGHQPAEPEQRIFLHFDYILSEEMQDCVDNYQEQIEALWQQPSGGTVAFDYWVNEYNQVKVVVYPVCLHYSRRAKYLSAYGLDPEGNIAWHNYRLDRIASKQLTILAWGDPSIPKALKTLWRTGKLPTPKDIQTQLEAAWGFNFYLERDLLIIRFPAAFARWYVDNTERHPTFKPIAYEQLPALIAQAVPDPQAQQQLLQILQARSPADAYYSAWIRVGDINVFMRLRDWRPNGEVIAPLSIRQRLKAEALEELSHYEL